MDIRSAENNFLAMIQAMAQAASTPRNFCKAMSEVAEAAPAADAFQSALMAGVSFDRLRTIAKASQGDSKRGREMAAKLDEWLQTARGIEKSHHEASTRKVNGKLVQVGAYDDKRQAKAYDPSEHLEASRSKILKPEEFNKLIKPSTIATAFLSAPHQKAHPVNVAMAASRMADDHEGQGNWAMHEDAAKAHENAADWVGKRMEDPDYKKGHFPSELKGLKEMAHQHHTLAAHHHRKSAHAWANDGELKASVKHLRAADEHEAKAAKFKPKPIDESPEEPEGWDHKDGGAWGASAQADDLSAKAKDDASHAAAGEAHHKAYIAHQDAVNAIQDKEGNLPITSERLKPHHREMDRHKAAMEKHDAAGGARHREAMRKGERDDARKNAAGFLDSLRSPKA